jgi:hypothetical protein
MKWLIASVILSIYMELSSGLRDQPRPCPVALLFWFEGLRGDFPAQSAVVSVPQQRNREAVILRRRSA